MTGLGLWTLQCRITVTTVTRSRIALILALRPSLVRLAATGTLSKVDGPLLWSYCRLWADACRLQADADALARTWYEKTSIDGAGVEHVEPKLHPVFGALKQYRLALRVFLVELGQTPLARNRITPQTANTPTMDPKKAKYLDGLTKPSA